MRNSLCLLGITSNLDLKKRKDLRNSLCLLGITRFCYRLSMVLLIIYFISWPLSWTLFWGARLSKFLIFEVSHFRSVSFSKCLNSEVAHFRSVSIPKWLIFEVTNSRSENLEKGHVYHFGKFIKNEQKSLKSLLLMSDIKIRLNRNMELKPRIDLSPRF